MGRKKLLIEEKTRVLTMLENRVFVIRVAANLHVSRQAIYDQNGRQQGFHLTLHHLEKWYIELRRTPQRGVMHVYDMRR